MSLQFIFGNSGSPRADESSADTLTVSAGWHIINIIDKISIESFFIFIYNPLIALCLYNILCTK